MAVVGEDAEGGLQSKVSGALAKLCTDLRAVSFCVCVLQGKAAQLMASLSDEEHKWTAPYGFACGICLQPCCMKKIPPLTGLFPLRPSVRSPAFPPFPPLEEITPLVSHRLEEVSAMDCGDLSLPIPSVVGRVEHMELQFGQETVLCSALVVGESVSPSSSPVFLCPS